jgi:hypothetical protein
MVGVIGNQRLPCHLNDSGVQGEDSVQERRHLDYEKSLN